MSVPANLGDDAFGMTRIGFHGVEVVTFQIRLTVVPAAPSGAKP